jgi:hypothetical protein
MRKKYYHVSFTLTDEIIVLHPRTGRTDSRRKKDLIPCICVAPSIEQALIASGDFFCFDSMSVYECEGNPQPADWIFDYSVTDEHRFYESVEFKLIGYIDIKKLQKKFKRFSYSSLDVCRRNIERLGKLELVPNEPYKKVICNILK